jgi:pSer/pThr/pTyr-binding forkhead associated (FHA) protein
MGTEIVIGRSSDLDMVLVEDMVSRRHARITAFNGELMIEDFGSTNGSFVNGERITKAKLKEGDRILIGTNIIKLVHRDSADRDASSMMGQSGGPQGGMGQTIGMDPRGVRPTGATMTGAIMGLIDEVPLPDLLQLFSTSKRNGVLVITTAHDTGKVFLRTGRVYFSMINDDREIDPYKAFYRMMSWKSGHFSLEPASDEKFSNEMDESVEGLMMEGMRQLDELQTLGSDVPEMEYGLAMVAPLQAPLRELKPNQLDVFQLALNYNQVGRVLNKSAESDLDVMQIVLFLLRNGYLRLVQ